IAFFFFFQAEDGIRDFHVTGVQTCALPICVAFQLADDVIDLSPESTKTGKLAGTDLRSGVDTMPMLKLRARAENDPEAAALLQRSEERRVGKECGSRGRPRQAYAERLGMRR